MDYLSLILIIIILALVNEIIKNIKNNRKPPKLCGYS